MSTSGVSGNKTTELLGSSDGWLVKLAGAGPQLNITATGNAVRIAWPLWVTGEVLEESNSLTDPDSWSQTQATPETDAAHRYVVLPVAEANRFYRLTKP
jgi:hypothetical protein